MKISNRKNGFTLIELLVTIGIIAVLIAIALPALSGAKKRASDVIGLSNLRQTGIAMENYVNQYGGWLPFAPGGTLFSVSPDIPPTRTVSSVHWDLSAYWSSLFHDVAPWEEWFEMWTYPDARRATDEPWVVERFSGLGQHGISSLRYSRALFGRPEIWEPGEMITDRDSVLRGVRLSEVRYPSSKVSLFDAELCARVRCDDPLGAKRGMLFIDGHAGMHAYSDAISPSKGRLEEFAGAAEPVHDTAGGARGRDY